MTHYILKLTFDLRQVTHSLAYEFLLASGESYPPENEGPLAGTFNFNDSDKVSVQVVATSDAPESGAPLKDILKSFSVANCTFISVPTLQTEHLSLFSQTNAAAAVGQWGPIKDISTPLDKEKNTLRLSTDSLEYLTVVSENGQWKISGYLSVSLTAADDQTQSQLYFFDPESTSGNGGDLP